MRNHEILEAKAAGAVGRLALGVALLGAPLAWTIHFLLSWGIAEWSGLSGTLTNTILGVTSRAWLLIGVSIVAVAIGLASTFIAHWCVRRLKPLEADATGTAAWFVARTGVVNGYLFTFVVAVESLPIFYYLRDA